jgi:hypothetical protein
LRYADWLFYINVSMCFTFGIALGPAPLPDRSLAGQQADCVGQLQQELVCLRAHLLASAEQPLV